MDPQQELFTRLLLDLKAKGYDVYDGELPPDGTPYPYIYIDDNLQDDTANKSAVFGEVTQTIHVWHNKNTQRGTVSAMLLDIKATCRAIEETANFSWLVNGMRQRIGTDTTTDTPLLHGVLTVKMKFS